MMRKLCWIFICCCFCSVVIADAGFGIRRKKALSIISFSGTENLKSRQLIYIPGYSYDTSKKIHYASSGRIVDKDYSIYTQEGGKNWDESERDINLLLVDTANNRITDSIHLFAKDFDLHLVITGDAGGKLQYKTDSSKAVYQYMITEDKMYENNGSYKRNRLIFIGSSLIGFILLIVLFIRRKNNINA